MYECMSKRGKDKCSDLSSVDHSLDYRYSSSEDSLCEPFTVNFTNRNTKSSDHCESENDHIMTEISDTDPPRNKCNKSQLVTVPNSFHHQNIVPDNLNEKINSLNSLLEDILITFRYFTY